MGWPSTLWPAPLGPWPTPTSAMRPPDIANRRVEHDTVVVHAPPFWHDRMADEAEGKLLVAFTTWETDRLPDEWLDILGRFDRVLVPSRFNADVFASSGLTVPIAVVPHIARPVPTPERDAAMPAGDSRFVVYLVATWRPGRQFSMPSRHSWRRSVRTMTWYWSSTPPPRIWWPGPVRPAGGMRRSRHEGSSWFTLARALGGRTDRPTWY